MKRIRLTLILCGLIATSNTMGADTLPGYYPKVFSVSGAFGGIDTAQQQIIINDTPFFFDTNVKVHTPDSQFSTLRSLHSGMKVGAKTITNQAKKELITEIWVLPKDHLSIPLPR